MNRLKAELGWASFCVLVVIIDLTFAMFYSWWIFIVPLLITLFVLKYKEDRILTLWLTLIIVLAILLIMGLSLTFENRIHFITGTDWVRIDAAHCEKEQIFKGVDTCDASIGRYVDSLNSTEKITLSPSTVPDCYEERCK